MGWEFTDEDNIPWDSQSDDDRVLVWIVTHDYPEEVQFAHYSMSHDLFSTMYKSYRPESVIKWMNVELPKI